MLAEIKIMKKREYAGKDKYLTQHMQPHGLCFQNYQEGAKACSQVTL